MMKLLLLSLVIAVLAVAARKTGGGSRTGGVSRPTTGGGRPVGGGGGGFVKPGSSNNGLSGGSSGFGKPSKGKWVKKVVIGAASAYTGYKATKALKKFKKRKTKKGKKSYEYDEWDDWRQDNGILCRDTDDCWLDDRLVCTDYELDRAAINPGWFGGEGEIIQIRGTCQCNDNSWWDDDDLSCLLFSQAKKILPTPLLALASVYFCVL